MRLVQLPCGDVHPHDEVVVDDTARAPAGYDGAGLSQDTCPEIVHQSAFFGEWDELVRSDATLRRVDPPGEGFRAEQATVAEVPFALVIRNDPPLLDCGTKIGLTGQLVGHPRTYREVVGLDAAPAELFRMVAGHVGPAEDLDGVGRRLVGRTVVRDTCTRTQYDRPTTDHERRLQAIEQRTGGVDALGRARDVTEEDEPLVAAESCDQRRVGDVAAEPLGDVAEQGITGLVTRVVVDHLEPVEIDQRYSHTLRATLGDIGEGDVQLFLERPAVR